MGTFPDQRIDWLTGPEGLLARRSWELVPSSGTVLLQGLLGFPWPKRDAQAKCTERDYGRRTEIFSPSRVDRHHKAVPAVGCTCGIYALAEPEDQSAMHRHLGRRFLVHGFVWLGGRILYDGKVYRAERARIEGPLVVSVPKPRRWDHRRHRSSASWVLADGDRFRIAHGTWAKAARGAIELGAWHQTIADQLGARYGITVEERALPAAA